MIRSLLGLLLFYCVAGCVQKNHNATPDQLPFQASHIDKPVWTGEEFSENNDYWYFVRSFTSDLSTPSFAYKLARKDMHAFFKEEAEFILVPLKSAGMQKAYADLVEAFRVYMSKRVMKKVRTEDMIYWEEVHHVQFGEVVKQRRYYVKLQLKKRQLRNIQKHFILKQQDKALHLNKQMLYTSLKESLRRVK